MTKSPQDPIRIRVDTQEQRSGIPHLLSDMPQVEVEIAQLQVGDYDIGGNPPRVLERKTASDFLISLADGRLFEQLNLLLASDFVPILLLEGDPLSVKRSQMNPASIRGAKTYITGILQVLIMPTSGPEESAYHLYSMAKQLQIGYALPGPAAGRRGASLSDQQMQILLSLPGVGLATARALCAHFHSIHEVFTADVAQLSAVRGVSFERATTLFQLLHAALPSSNNSSTGEA